MVDAKHSSSYTDDGVITYLGEAAGYVLTFENGLTVYFAGDTALFGDMRLIHDLYRPTVAFLPIGDLFTMDPVAAAKACELLGVKTGHPDALRHVPGPGRPARAAARTGGAPRRRGDRDEAGRNGLTCDGAGDILRNETCFQIVEAAWVMKSTVASSPPGATTSIDKALEVCEALSLAPSGLALTDVSPRR